MGINMNPYHVKLAAAEQILGAVTWEQMTRALDSWSMFFCHRCPATDAAHISESYETLRQRAHEFLTNHRLDQLEERLNSISHESS